MEQVVVVAAISNMEYRPPYANRIQPAWNAHAAKVRAHGHMAEGRAKVDQR